MHTCLIGQQVEVQTKNGQVHSGIFHAAKIESKDLGVILKMARLIKDGTVKGGKSEAVKDALRKPPLKSYIIHGKDFVQIVAKVSSGLMASGIQVFLHLKLPSFTRSF
jgi:hypothetical protein